MKFAYIIEPPFNYINDKGILTGCDVELAKIVLSKIGVDDFEPIETEFAELLPGVSQGSWRMTTGLFATKERQKIASFSRPIWALPDGLLVQKDNPKQLTGYKSIAETPDCVLAVLHEQIQHLTALECGVLDTQIRLFDTYEQAANAVLGGQVDAYASVARAHFGYLAQHGISELEIVAVPFDEKEPAFGCFAFSKSDDEFRASINEALVAYLGSDHHRSMMATFGFSDDEIDLVTR